MPRGRKPVFTAHERAVREILERYPEYEVPIKQFLEREYPVDAVKETCRLARKYHVSAGLVFEILESMMASAKEREGHD